MANYSIFKSATDDMDYLMQEAGESILVNGIEKQAIVKSNKAINNGINTRKITTKEKIKQGDIITWRDKPWLTTSEVAVGTGYVYKAVLQHMLHTVKVHVGNEKIAEGTDSMGRPIYKEQPVYVEEACIINDLSYSTVGLQVKVPTSELEVTLRDCEETQKIKINNSFDFGLYTYKVEHIDLSRVGMIILHCKK